MGDISSGAKRSIEPVQKLWHLPLGQFSHREFFLSLDKRSPFESKTLYSGIDSCSAMASMNAEDLARIRGVVFE
jgi:hypothetical protein